jgi:hypothetical protein
MTSISHLLCCGIIQTCTDDKARCVDGHQKKFSCDRFYQSCGRMLRVSYCDQYGPDVRLSGVSPRRKLLFVNAIEVTVFIRLS